MRRATSASQRGVSLVEAIVAMAVMAFGMLAIVGLQSTLRQNADVAKQRSEAVRIAEQAIEEWRGYSVMPTTAGLKAYDDLALGALPDVPLSGTNANYTLRQTVTAFAPGLKSLRAEVSWVDRAGQPQSIVLNTIIAAADPALSGRLTMAPGGGAALPPQGRHAAIPVVAKDLGGGLSGYKPPAPGGAVVWVFNNLTGVIVGVCNSVVTGQASLSAADVASCSNNANGLPLSGFVRFSTGAVQPTAADAENPASSVLNLEVMIPNISSSGNANPAYSCYSDAPISYLLAATRTTVAYHCAILFSAGAPLVWSGTSELSPLPFTVDLPTPPPVYVPWTLASSGSDGDATRYRICRYTPAASDTDPVPNRLHPRQYSNVDATQPLTNQNFLVIRAGNFSGTSGGAFTCPTDVAADPAHGDFVNSNTLPHQPPP